ncbi:hypothetical protein EJ04DRAFT_524613 [Polyplosphaeria fusca]|uniref:Uncharacterized protein n=1 Tax=Polyplosphaeria fusca TaxID=682080 RepID=A0A9P4QYN7_9PLEO|nr:hypothetical protein EJ04DRAFT_524613 [Polyplosphaeria fusca]
MVDEAACDVNGGETGTTLDDASRDHTPSLAMPPSSPSPTFCGLGQPSHRTECLANTSGHLIVTKNVPLPQTMLGSLGRRPACMCMNKGVPISSGSAPQRRQLKQRRGDFVQFPSVLAYQTLSSRDTTPSLGEGNSKDIEHGANRSNQRHDMCSYFHLQCWHSLYWDWQAGATSASVLQTCIIEVDTPRQLLEKGKVW